jgi:hypothetical protein
VFHHARVHQLVHEHEPREELCACTAVAGKTRREGAECREAAGGDQRLLAEPRRLIYQIGCNG